MKVTAIETMSCDAGWRNYCFVKLSTDEGVVGWSEYDEGAGSPGVTMIINKLGNRLIGKDVNQHERFFAEVSCQTRPAPGSVIGESIGAIENALLDAKAKALNVPCYELLGGKIRDRVRVYWSHCPTWRINVPQYIRPTVTDLEGVKNTGKEVRERGFTALKTNIVIHDEGPAFTWRPGFGEPFYPELNVDRKLIRNIRSNLEALRDGAGPDMDIMIDLNFNAKPEGLLKILRAIEDMDLFWVEIDNFSPKVLAYVRNHSRHPISSCEALFGIRQFMPFINEQAMDVAIIDVVWNGVWQSMKIAAVAEAHEINVAPHNYYGDLCTMISAHFSAAVPNLSIMEVDIDRLSWESELFTHAPEFEDGHLIIPARPGWGTDPIEDAIRAHPPKLSGVMLEYRRGAAAAASPRR